jgi:hypothetical protein
MRSLVQADFSVLANMHTDSELFPFGGWHSLRGVFFAHLLSGLESVPTTGKNHHNQRNPATDNGALLTLQLNFSEGHKQMLSLWSQPLVN